VQFAKQELIGMDAPTQPQMPLRPPATEPPRRILRPWFGLGFLWLLVLALVLGGARLAYYSKTRFSAQLEALQGLQEAFKDSSVLMGLVVEMEKGQRDFLLTQDRAALESYRAAVTQLPQQVEHLQSMLRQRPEVQAELQELVRITELERGDLEALQAAGERQGPDAALKLARSAASSHAHDMGSSRAAVVNLQMNLVEMSIREQQLLHEVIARRNLAIYLTILLGAAAAAGALFLLRRQYLTLHEEQQLRARVVESQRESRQKSNFLANMSHEIRTPMNAILGFSQLLLERVGDSVSRRYVEAITVSGRSLLALIDDVLDLSKIEAGKLEIRAVPTSLREIADGVVAVFSQHAANKRLALTAEIDPSVPVSVLVDAARLRQMLFNLVGNAIKYTDRGGVVLRVHSHVNAQDPQLLGCVFEVQDSGIGIAPEEMAHIFEPFTQAEAGRALPREGTGLGLAITRQLAESMGGSLEVESTLGQGSVFRILLPRVAASIQPPLPPEQGGVSGELPPTTVLVVDDVELNRDLVAAMFEGSGHRVLRARNGAEALALAHSQRPRVILMDILMPGMDGIETLQRLRADPALGGIHVIAVTASTLRGEQTRLRELFDGYVAKPFTRDSLFAEFGRVLRGLPAPQEQVAPLAEAQRRRLQRLLLRDWPAVRAAPAMRDVKNFAQAIDELALAAQRDELRGYARELNDAAFAFDALRVETLLEEFPARSKDLLSKGEGR